MATVHTTARGTEPYDKVYCLAIRSTTRIGRPTPASTNCARLFWTVVMMWM